MYENRKEIAADASNTSGPIRASVRDTRGAGGLRHRSARPTARPVRAFLVAALIVTAGCASPRPDPSVAVPTSPEPTTPAPSSAPSPVETADISEAVVAAYERYLAATSVSMETGDGTHPALVEVARGQALAAAQARVVALASQGRMASGDLVPSIQDVQIEGGTATIIDCYRADLTEHDPDTGEQIADRAGARLRATAELAQGTDGAWTVTAFREGDTCVPAELAEQIEERYRAFWQALAEAGAPPDRDHPQLAEVAAGEQLDGLRRRLADFADQRFEIRDGSTSHPLVVEVRDRDTIARVRDCRELDPVGGVYDTDSGQLVDGGAREGQHALWFVRLELIDGRWKVVDADLAEEDSSCAASS